MPVEVAPKMFGRMWKNVWATFSLSETDIALKSNKRKLELHKIYGLSNYQVVGMLHMDTKHDPKRSYCPQKTMHILKPS